MDFRTMRPSVVDAGVEPERVVVGKPVPAEEPNRRAELLRAAARLFRDQGYEATTIRDIAAAVGMRSGSPFYHFKSKQDMLKAVVLEGLSAALEEMRQAKRAQRSARDTFIALMRAHLGTILERGGDFMPVLLYEWRSLSEESRAEIVMLKDRYEAAWQETLDRLKEEGLIRADTKISRLLIFGALNWTAQWFRPDGPLSVDQIAEHAAALFLLDQRCSCSISAEEPLTSHIF